MRRETRDVRWGGVDEIAPASEWPHAPGEMAGRIRAHDWAATPLGAARDWPEGLRTLTDMMLATPQLATLAIGQQRIFLYNDEAARHYGARHPAVLGLPLADAFAHEFEAVAPFYDRVFAGASVHVPAQPLDPAGRGEDELFDAYLTPVRDNAGRVIAAYMTGFATGGRRRAEAALRESEERLRRFGEASQDALWIRDAATLRWQYLTPGFAAIYGGGSDQETNGNDYGRWLNLIVPEDRARVAANIDRARAGEQVAYEFRIRRPGGGGVRWIRNIDFPIRDGAGEVTAIGGIGSDVTALREAELRLRALVAGIPQLVWRAVGDGLWTWASPQWTAFTGQAEPDSHDFGWLDPVHPDDRERVRQIWAGAIERGGFEAEFRLARGEDGRFRWFRTRATPVRDSDGRIAEWLGTSTDVDDLRRLQERQQVLVGELQHRVRNILTVVRSVFGRTFDAPGDPEDVGDHFKGRLDSLARAQVVAAQSASGLVDLENLIRDELMSVGARDGPTLAIAGPSVALPPGVVEPIGLAIHELTTNALKYGALKVPDAMLEIGWAVNLDYGGRRRLDFTWIEHGVPAIAVEPARRGFGSELINEALPHRLGAETSLEFRGGGVRCTISVPLPSEVSPAMPDWKEV